MTGYLVRLLLAAALAFVLVLAAWSALRLWRARSALGRLGDERHAEDALRARAEAVLAARLARGEIDRATYERLMERLWGLPAGTAPTPAGAAPAGPAPVATDSPPSHTSSGNPPPA